MCFVADATKRNGRVTNPPATILYDYPFLLSNEPRLYRKGHKKSRGFYASAYLFNYSPYARWTCHEHSLIVRALLTSSNV